MTVRMIVSAGEALRPLAKNLIRACGVTQGVRVLFGRGAAPAVTYSGTAYDAAEKLADLLAAVTTENLIPEDTVQELERFTAWLAALPGVCPGSQNGALRALLEEVRRQSDYRTAGQPAPEWAAFWENWKAYYPVPQTFCTTGQGTINEINRGEAGDYLEGHLKTAGEVSYIHNAIDSLLSSIPEDVESILDIGSGPGYVNSRLPADYSILAMDIDEEILRGNTRQTCLGDIMDIPLADRSVDLVMACDMLEHLPDEVLEKGALELDRVSRKYIYLQVPFQEDPIMAYARCPQCGNVWHVNHHKRSFDEERLRSVLPDNWECVLVNYTGDVTYRRSGRIAAELAERFDWKVYGAAGCPCPVCGAQSEVYGASDLKLMQRVAEYDTDSPFPVYSEIGILFRRTGEENELPPAETLLRRRREALGVLPRDGELQLQQVYTKTELLPSLYLSGCRLAERGERLCIEKLEGTKQAWAAVAFPPLRKQAGAEVNFIGSLSEPGEVGVGLLDDAGSEQFAAAWNWGTEDTVSRLPIPGARSVRSAFVKLYFTADKLFLRDCRLQGGERAAALIYPHEKSTFLSFMDGDTEVRLYAPAGESLRLSHSPAEWRRVTNDVKRREDAAVARFAADLTAGVDTGDNRTLIAQDRSGELLAQQAPPAVYTPAMREENRRIVMLSLYVEAELAIYYRAPEQRRKNLRRKLLGVLKRGKDKLHGWLHRHERLYEFMISLGLKDLYQKMKRRIVR